MQAGMRVGYAGRQEFSCMQAGRRVGYGRQAGG